MRTYDQRSGAAEERDAASRPPRHAETAIPTWDGVAGGRAPLTPSVVLRLQRTVGNAGVSALLQHLQRRDDGSRHGSPPPASVQRSPVHDVLRSPGQPLAEPVRADMEARLNADFSDVRVHTDAAAHESAVVMQAHAYTSGSHVVFARGRYDTSSPGGRHILAHELTHVVQQRRGPVAGTPTADGLAVSHPSDRFEREAEASAQRAMSSPPPGSDASRTPTADAHPMATADGHDVVQRKIGFEFEASPDTMAVRPPLTDDERQARVIPMFPTTRGAWGPRPTGGAGAEIRGLVKKEELLSGPGYTAEADERSTGGSNLEFVTVAFPETDDGRRALQTAMEGILALAAHLSGSGPREAEDLAGLGGATVVRNGLAPNERRLIYPVGQVAGNPQTTAGIRLEEIDALLQEMQRAAGQVPVPGGQAPPSYDLNAEDRARVVAQGQSYANAALNAFGGNHLADEGFPDTFPSPQLRGLVSLVATYLIAGSSQARRAYVKALAPILARTDFATSYKLLPISEQLYLGDQDGDRFVELMLAAGTANGMDDNPAHPVLVGGLAGGTDLSAVTRDLWLRRITQGVDVMSRAGYTGEFPADAQKAGEFESMGSLPRTENVGGGTGLMAVPLLPAPILELRRMRQRVPYTEWPALALAVFDFVRDLNAPGVAASYTRTQPGASAPGPSAGGRRMGPLRKVASTFLKKIT